VLGGDLAGFPNGRRPYDDVVDVTLRVAEGALCGAIGNCGTQTGDPITAYVYDGARAAGATQSIRRRLAGSIWPIPICELSLPEYADPVLRMESTELLRSRQRKSERGSATVRRAVRSTPLHPARGFARIDRVTPISRSFP